MTSKQSIGAYLWEVHGCDTGKKLQFAKDSGTEPNSQLQCFFGLSLNLK